MPLHGAVLSYTFEEIGRKAKYVRDIDLKAVLKLLECKKDKSDKAKWHTPKGILSITGPKFMNWTEGGGGGGGAIDLVMHLKQYDFKTAVIWLTESFSFTAAQSSFNQMACPSRRRFRLPERDNERLAHVINYLTYNRCIPRETITHLVHSGKLYADKRGNAVFLLLGKKKRIVGAELRKAGEPRWMGMAPGSNKSEGCFYIKRSDTMKMVLCESAIDAISCFMLNDNVITLSTAGANHKPAWLLRFINKGFEIYCGFDADKTGDTLAEKMITNHPTVKRLRPIKHDWNEVLKSISHNK